MFGLDLFAFTVALACLLGSMWQSCSCQAFHLTPKQVKSDLVSSKAKDNDRVAALVIACMVNCP